MKDDAKLTTGTVGQKHGAGGVAMRKLVKDVFIDALAAPDPRVLVNLSDMDDGAVIRVGDRNLVMTTDSYVVKPLFFPGGDIGRVAVSGTVNDLAMMGGVDVLGLGLSVILEEGFPLELLVRIRASASSGKPSSRITDRPSPSTSTPPIMARSFTVPDTATRPMSPPGKNRGFTT